MTPSCTMAIYLSLKALNIKKDDEIIVPDVTWTATVSPIVELGAKPIFVDINKNDWCINTEKIIEKISKKNKSYYCCRSFWKYARYGEN